MRVKTTVSLIAVAALIGAGATVALHRHHNAVVAEVAQTETSTPVAPPPAKSVKATPAKRARTQVAVATAPATTRTAQQAASLPEGGLVKITGMVTSTSPNTLTITRGLNDNAQLLRIVMRADRDWYWPYTEDHSDKPGIGSTVTIYGRAHDVTRGEPTLDADAVYLPASGVIYYSNGKNQTSNQVTGNRSLVRFVGYKEAG